MRLIRPPRDYASIDAFYDELPDVDRRLSTEREYGVEWTEPYSKTFPTFRVSLVQMTGELYELNQSTGAVRVLAIFDAPEEAEFVLAGWAEHCGQGGFAWLRDRLERAVPRYICGNCVARGRNPDTSFDPDAKCRNCRHGMTLDPEHEANRLRRPAAVCE